MQFEEMVAGKFCAWSCRRSANYYGKTPPPVDAPGEVGARVRSANGMTGGNDMKFQILIYSMLAKT
jgi:hypothetical protein